jgi:hypothetical protein
LHREEVTLMKTKTNVKAGARLSLPH